jgi:hypothetical protein
VTATQAGSAAACADATRTRAPGAVRRAMRASADEGSTPTAS